MKKTVLGTLFAASLLALGSTAHAQYAPRQDLDRDGIQNRYDRDRDGDGIPNARDPNPDRFNPQRASRHARDMDRDGIANRSDRDMDGDGIPNRRDRFPMNPRRA